jgi:hypothetical protein
MRLLRRLRVPAALLVACGVAYVALLVHPQPLFAYSLARGNVTLHARTPFPVEAGPILDDALARVRRSPLYDPAVPHHVYFCPSAAFYSFFATGKRRSRGVTLDYLNGNVFIGPSSIEKNEVYGPSGRPAGPDRPLAYFLAHEITHHMTSATIGRLAYFRLPAWVREGYADYVGRAAPVDLSSETERLRNGDRDFDPHRSGLYLRYRLEVAWLLERERASVLDLLHAPPRADAVDEALLAAFPKERLRGPGMTP